MRRLSKTFLKGLVATLPILLTIYILYWLAITAEAFFGRIVRVFLPASWEVPGVGIVIGVLLVYLVGLMLDLWIARRLLLMIEGLVLRVPLVKSIYSALRDFMGFVSGGAKSREAEQVVLVRITEDMRLIGFVTRRDWAGFPANLGVADTIAVYLPMSYQIGGYTVYLPRARVEALDMPMEDAMRLTLTAGVATSAPTPPARRQ